VGQKNEKEIVQIGVSAYSSEVSGKYTILRGSAVKRVYFSFLLVAALIASGCGINDIPEADEKVKSSWSEVQNQYQRRADLVPNLVAVVKEAEQYESETLEAIVKARSEVVKASEGSILLDPEKFEQYQHQQDLLSLHLRRLSLQIERYPSLMVNQNFIQLSAQLEGTENRIMLARREFIKSVENYNVALKTYPGKLYHEHLYKEYKLRDDPVYFRVSDGESEKVPEVKF